MNRHIPEMELHSLSELCLSNISTNSHRYSIDVVEGLPRLILDKLSLHLSAYWLHNWHDVFSSRNVDLNQAWKTHYMYQKSMWSTLLYKKGRQCDLIHDSDYKQLYMERYFHELLWFVAPSKAEPADPRHRFCTEMTRLQQVNVPSSRISMTRSRSAEDDLLDAVRYVRRLSVRVGMQCSYLLQKPHLIAVLQKNIMTVALQQLTSRHYDSVVNGLLVMLVHGAQRLVELELVNVNISLAHWQNLLALASGKSIPPVIPQCPDTLQTKTYPSSAGVFNNRKRMSRYDDDDEDDDNNDENDDLYSHPCKKHCTEYESDLYDEVLTSYKCAESAVSMETSTSDSHVCSESEDKSGTSHVCSFTGFTSFSVLAQGQTDFTGILGASLQAWPSLTKLVINQPVSNSYKVIILQEINKRVASGQLRHVVLRGCLAAASQIEQLYNALHVRHENGEAAMECLELESSFVWTSNSIPLPYQATAHGRGDELFEGVRHLAVSESTMVDEACNLLARWLHHDLSLTSVSLSALKLGMIQNAIPSVLQAMAENGRLHVISLSDMIFTTEANPHLVALLKSSPQLKEFAIENCHLELDPGSCDDFFRAVAEHPSLERLHVSGSLLGDKACRLIEYLFTRSKPYPRLLHLHMNACRIQGGALLQTIRNLQEQRETATDSNAARWRLETLSLGGNAFADHLSEIRLRFKSIVTKVHAWDVIMPQADHVSIM